MRSTFKGDTAKLKRNAALTCLAKARLARQSPASPRMGWRTRRTRPTWRRCGASTWRPSRLCHQGSASGQCQRPEGRPAGPRHRHLPWHRGMREEFLPSMTDVWDEEEMARLEEFSMLYLTGTLPPWWYKVWGSVNTVPLLKTRERESARPVGVTNPLIRSLHSLVIKENRSALTSYLEVGAGQRCPSEWRGSAIWKRQRMRLCPASGVLNRLMEG